MWFQHSESMKYYFCKLKSLYLSSPVSKKQHKSCMFQYEENLFPNPGSVLRARRFPGILGVIDYFYVHILF